jgi:hypothetical protein
LQIINYKLKTLTAFGALGNFPFPFENNKQLQTIVYLNINTQELSWYGRPRNYDNAGASIGKNASWANLRR